jgi:hypothetical protein
MLCSSVVGKEPNATDYRAAVTEKKRRSARDPPIANALR